MSDAVKRFWENYGPVYQRDCQIPVDVQYGPGSPNEAELQLLGPVAGKHVLEIGCGGAQCAVAFAKQGALVSAVDIAAAQLEFARALAHAHGASISFYQRNMADLAPIPDQSQDIVFSAFALGYVEDLRSCFREAQRVLKLDGLFVWSQGHPCYILDGASLRPARSYFKTGMQIYGEGEAEIPFAVNHHTISDYINLLAETGFYVERMVEPDSRNRYPSDPWYGMWDYIPELMGYLPPTIIFKCRKLPQVDRENL
jgi:2-polyprenyl-3-methyl-5-hydroxy-6-metoxy-1,4-benzoquinol methylase